MKTNLIKKEVNKVYYIALTNNENAKDCLTRLKLSTDDIINVDINMNNQLVITTTETLTSGYEKLEIMPSYENIGYITPITFCEKNYQIITINIIKSMYNSTKSWNYTACNSIVNSRFTDDIINDLKQVCFMTMYENLSYLVNSPIDNRIYFESIFAPTTNCKIYDSKINDFIIKECPNVFIACYRSISNYLYNQKSKYDTKQIAIIGYDDNNNSDISIAINNRAYTDYCISQGDSLSFAACNEFLEIIENVKCYITFTEKPKVSKYCNSILDLLVVGTKKKDIATKLDISSTTITKYHNIIKNAFYELYKKPQIKKSKKVKPDTIKKNSFINITVCKQAIKSYEIHDKKQALYNNLFGVDNTMIDNRINFVHESKQNLYNRLFG